MRIAVVGMGNLGSAVALVAAKNGHEVLAWDYSQTVVDEINQHQTNGAFLANKAFPITVIASHDLPAVLDKPLELLLITLPSQFIEPVFSLAELKAGVAIVNMSKGLDVASHETVVQSLQRKWPHNPIAMLSGPSLANEFAYGVATGFVVASESRNIQHKVAEVFNNEHIAVRFSDDLLGVELGGILKNIYALGLGAVDTHPQSGLNFKGAYLSLAFQEIKKIAGCLGAQPQTFDDISGLGDLMATMFSEHSHNRSMGKWLAKGLSIDDIAAKMPVLAEGYGSLKVVINMAEKHQLSIPLAQLINNLVDQLITLDEFYKQFVVLLKSAP